MNKTFEKIYMQIIKESMDFNLDEQSDGSGFQILHNQNNAEQDLLDIAEKQGKKYILHHQQHGFWRIQACKNFSDVKRGDFGGLIISENNLSHEGDCWIYNNVQIFDSAKISGNAKARSNAHIYGHAKIYGDTLVAGNCWIHDNAQIYDNAKIYGNASITGKAKIYGNAQVYGDARVYGEAKVYGDAKIYGDARVLGFAEINYEVSKGDMSLPPAAYNLSSYH